MSRRKIALILGSGFSKEAGLPTTSELSNVFLDSPSDGVLNRKAEDCITEILRQFWKYAFDYEGGDLMPSLEDHFTLLDLSANSGHQLGRQYPPRKLRAIRRMSIHRVFQILDASVGRADRASQLLLRLHEMFDVSIITLNWDIVVELLLKANGRSVSYGITIGEFPDTFETIGGTPLLKVHGSSNWVYCDCCRRLYAGTRKSALYQRAFLEEKDFELFVGGRRLKGLGLGNHDDRKCPHCGNVMAGRVATFSYRKAFSINQFQTIWDKSHEHLSNASIWLFVGYSMPQADFEFRHLLKSAQLACCPVGGWKCEAIVGTDRNAAERYRGFFGLQDDCVRQESLSWWVEHRLDDFCRKNATA